MAIQRAQRTSQFILNAEFIFSFNDTATDSVSATSKTFGSVFADAIVFDAINMPRGAVIVGGDLVVETAGVGPTAYTLAIGTSTSASAYLAATSLLAAGRTALLLTTPLSSLAGQNVRLTIASTVANATAGKFRVNVQYVIEGKGGNDVAPS